MHDLRNIDSHLRRATLLQKMLSAQSTRSKDQLWVPQMTSFPGVIIHSHRRILITLGCFFHGKGNILFFLLECFYSFIVFILFFYSWINTSSVYRFAFPARQGHCENYSLDIQKDLSIAMVFHGTALFLIKKYTSQQKTCGNGPIITEFTVPTTFLTTMRKLA